MKGHMRKRFGIWLVAVGILTIAVSSGALAAGAPDMYKLKNSGFIIKSRVAGFESDGMWEPMIRWMKSVTDFDPLVAQIEDIVCGTGTN